VNSHPLVDVVRDLEAIHARLSTKWTVGIQRTTRKRAEIAALLSLYTDVLVIGRRLAFELEALAVATDCVFGRGPDQSDRDEASSAMFDLTRSISVDVKSLYHWCYAIEVSLRKAQAGVDVEPLERLSVFRSKMLVHHADTPLFRDGDIVIASVLSGPDPQEFHVTLHPFFRPRMSVRQLVFSLERLNPYVPGLAAEHNLWEKVDLVYRHYIDIPRGTDREWVRNVVLGRTGMKSDPPARIMETLLQALNSYARLRHA
jgi:hypothetical protein